MESFQMCTTQMLKEFRALLQISPITINSHRLLQLISLNMFAITCTELKGESPYQKFSSPDDESKRSSQTCRDCLNFIGNRLRFFRLLRTLSHFGMDALLLIWWGTGVRKGRMKVMI
jgi:hypothetical protein